MQKLVLKDWSITVADSQVRLRKLEVPYVIPRLDIEIDDSLGFTVRVFGWFLCENHNIYKSTRRSLRNITVSNLIKEIEQLALSIGLTESAFSGDCLQHVLPWRLTRLIEMNLPVLFPPKNTIEQRTVRFLSKEVNAIANFVLKKSVIKNNQSKGDKQDSWYQQNQKHQ